MTKSKAPNQASSAAPLVGRWYRHYKGGVYVVLTIARSCTNTEPEHELVIYSGDSGTWAREISEFCDGRFVVCLPPNDELSDSAEQPGELAPNQGVSKYDWFEPISVLLERIALYERRLQTEKRAAASKSVCSTAGLGVALARAAESLADLADAYEREGAAALARETRCIAEMMKARDSVLSGGGATPSDAHQRAAASSVPKQNKP